MTVPSFDLKIDAIPGKINTAYLKWINLEYIMDNVLSYCGKDHAFMPIAIRVVSYKNVWRLN
ncbi:hypothetical protein ACA081_01265 [Candidatus Hodgkinia cicadicola]